MPGRSPTAAVKAFTKPLQIALSCIGNVHISLSQGALGAVGETHSWTLNDGTRIPLGNGLFFTASMKFETLDRGRSEEGGRYRISTREYIYEVTGPGSRQIISAHWHPLARNSRFAKPHWHIGGVTGASDRVYLDRAHIPSPRVSIEEFIRLMIEDLGVQPRTDDWDSRLRKTHKAFAAHMTWGSLQQPTV
jgi:hypothetical protein